MEKAGSAPQQGDNKNIENDNDNSNRNKKEKSSGNINNKSNDKNNSNSKKGDKSGVSKFRFPRRGGAAKNGDRVLGSDGITVVSAFEGYAFDAGMRAGDRITAINGQSVAGISVDKARDMLRGEPDSKVSISFIRDGINQSEQVG